MFFIRFRPIISLLSVILSIRESSSIYSLVTACPEDCSRARAKIRTLEAVAAAVSVVWRLDTAGPAADYVYTTRRDRVKPWPSDFASKVRRREGKENAAKNYTLRRTPRQPRR